MSEVKRYDPGLWPEINEADIIGQLVAELLNERMGG